MTKLYTTLLLVIVALGLAGFVFWRYFYLATIAIDPIPSQATIAVNGQPSVDRTLRVGRGTYEIQVSAPGYRSETFTVQVGIGSRINKRIELTSLPRPQKVLDGPIRSLAASPDRKNLFFERAGILSIYSLEVPQPAPAVPITPVLSDLAAVDWAPDFSLALIKKTNGEVGLYDFKRYDLLHQEYRPLSQTIKGTAWSADGNGFYYLEQDANGATTIKKANRAGTGITQLYDITNFPMQSLQLQTGPPNLVILSSNDTTKTSDVVVFDAYQRLMSPITDSGRATAPALSADKTQVAYLDSGELVTTDMGGKNKRNHNLRPKTKSFGFVNNTTLAVLLPNQVILIDVTTGNRQTYEVFAPNDSIDSLFGDPTTTDTIYYTYQGSLYQIKIKE